MSQEGKGRAFSEEGSILRPCTLYIASRSQKMHLLIGGFCGAGITELPAILLMLMSPEPLPLFRSVLEDTTPPLETFSIRTPPCGAGATAGGAAATAGAAQGSTAATIVLSATTGSTGQNQTYNTSCVLRSYGTHQPHQQTDMLLTIQSTQVQSHILYSQSACTCA